VTQSDKIKAVKRGTLIKMTNGITFFMYFFSCGNLLSSVDITLLSGKPLLACQQTHDPVPQPFSRCTWTSKLPRWSSDRRLVQQFWVAGWSSWHQWLESLTEPHYFLILSCTTVNDYRVKMQNPLKLANRSQPLVHQCWPYWEDMWRRYCYLTSFFPIADTCLSCEDIAQQIWAMVRR